MPSRKHFFKFWKLIEREHAVQYMMISLLSSVATVSVVRVFLALTGYPQIGNGTLHIAHVLWGGLILYIAAILPLVYMNPRLHTAGAILSGVGVGLFIDEVGKFITRQYDYFFPAAAPIIYVFFLLVTILVIMIRRPEKVDGRAELVQALEIVREQLYRPLEAAERTHVEQELTQVMQNDPDELHQGMARRLMEMIQADPRVQPVATPSAWLRIGERAQAWLTKKRLSWFLGVGMAILGLVTLKDPLQFWLEKILPGSGLVSFLQAHAGRQIPAAEAPQLYHSRIILEVVIGIVLLVSAGLLAAGKKRLALNLGYFSLLASLVVLDMLLFYFEQFSTIGVVLLQFLLLAGVINFRGRYLKRMGE